jgi:mRNA interferase RelE/StbE
VANYRVRVKASAERELEAFDSRARERVLGKLESLAGNPRPAGVKKLRGFRDLWRICVGDFRVVYSIDDAHATVAVLRIAHRRDVYD